MLLMPLAAKNILLSSKRKVGRPALARRALSRQPLASIMEADDDEIDETDAFCILYSVFCLNHFNKFMVGHKFLECRICSSVFNVIVFLTFSHCKKYVSKFK